MRKILLICYILSLVTSGNASDIKLNLFGTNINNILGTSLSNVVGTIEQGWTPAELTDLGFWVDASDTSTLTLFTNKVGRWNDKSLEGRDLLQETDINRPAYIVDGWTHNVTKPVVSFENPTTLLWETPWSQFTGDPDHYNQNVFVVVDMSEALTTVSQQFFFPSSSTKSLSFGFGDTQLSGRAKKPYIFWDGIKVVSSVAVANFGIIRWGIETISAVPPYVARGYVQVNGGTINSSNLDPKFLYNWLMIGHPDGQYVPKVKIAEIIFVSDNISDADREKIEGYLAHKWGLADSLPEDHQYKTVAP